MRKKLMILLAIFAFMIVGSVAVTKLANRENKSNTEDDMVVITSFYPMYILTSNLTKGVPGVTVTNLTENQTGCLHDYQLTTKDMIQMDSADLFIMNGGGMEGFVEEVVKTYPKLNVISASDGIELLPSKSEHNHDHEADQEVEEHEHDHEEDQKSEEHDHDHKEDQETEDHNHNHEEDQVTEEHNHDHGDHNAHVWMNMNDYLVQMENVYHALVEYDPEHKKLYQANYDEYQNEIEMLKAEYEDALKDIVNEDVVIFHDAFAYMADQLGLDVVYTVNLDDDTYLSAGEVREIIDEVNLHDVKVLFTEEQYSDSIADSIAKETNAKVYVIDSLVTGSNELDSYLVGMRNNLEVLKKALYA